MTTDSLASVSRFPFHSDNEIHWPIAKVTSICRHHPTESLILPNKRRFFPFKIPNLSVH